MLSNVFHVYRKIWREQGAKENELCWTERRQLVESQGPEPWFRGALRNQPAVQGPKLYSEVSRVKISNLTIIINFCLSYIALILFPSQLLKSPSKYIKSIIGFHWRRARIFYTYRYREWDTDRDIDQKIEVDSCEL